MLVAVVLGLTLAQLWTPAISFNLDTENAVVYQGDRDSLFGFSVAAHRDQQTGWWVEFSPSPSININININAISLLRWP